MRDITCLENQKVFVDHGKQAKFGRKKSGECQTKLDLKVNKEENTREEF